MRIVSKFATESPLQYEIDVPHRRVHVRYHRQPRFDEWETTMDEVFRDARLDTGFGIVLDRREVQRAASTDYIRRMVEFIDVKNEKFGQMLWAIVVADLTSFGVGRMAEQIANGATIRTFLNFEQALEWLGSSESNQAN
jgi:hypothetical protein